MDDRFKIAEVNDAYNDVQAMLTALQAASNVIMDAACFRASKPEFIRPGCKDDFGDPLSPAQDRLFKLQLEIGALIEHARAEVGQDRHPQLKAMGLVR